MIPSSDITIGIELNLGSWTDVTADCMWSRRMKAQYGSWSQQPASLVASPGTFQFELDNSRLNSGGVVGYYTPSVYSWEPSAAEHDHAYSVDDSASEYTAIVDGVTLFPATVAQDDSLIFGKEDGQLKNILLPLGTAGDLTTTSLGVYRSEEPAWESEVDSVADFDSENDADGDLNDSGTQIAVTFDDATQASGRVLLAAIDQTQGTIRFTLNPNTFGLKDAKTMNFMYVTDGGGNIQWLIGISINAGVYSIRIGYGDDFTVVNSVYLPIEDADANWLMTFQRSSGAGNDDGYLYVYRDGELFYSVEDCDNDAVDWDYVDYGMCWTNSTAFGGSFTFGDIKISSAIPSLTELTSGTDYAVHPTASLETSLEQTSAPLVVCIEPSSDAFPTVINSVLSYWVHIKETNASPAYATNPIAGELTRRSGFGVGIGARLKITYGSEYTRWTGRIKKVIPKPGTYGDLVSTIECGDWISDASRIKPRGITVQSDQTGDELLTTALAAIDNQPTATSFDEGLSTFPTAFDDVRDGQTTIYNIMRSIAGSEWGHITEQGDGTLLLQNRYAYYGIPSSDALITLTGTGESGDITSFVLEDDDAMVYNNILGRVYPRTVDTDVSVLWSLQSTSESIPAGETRTFIGEYRDPNNQDVRVGGADMEDPVSGTDYICSGADSDLSFITILGGNSVEYAITNNGSTSVTLTTLQVRGKRVVTYEPISIQASDSDSIEAHGDRNLNLIMPYQNSANTGVDFTDWALEQYKGHKLRPRSVSFLANKSAAMMTAALAAEPGNIVTITEPVSGWNGDCVITGISLKIAQHNLIHTTFALEPKPTTSFFALDTSELNGNDQLAF